MAAIYSNRLILTETKICSGIIVSYFTTYFTLSSILSPTYFLLNVLSILECKMISILGMFIEVPDSPLMSVTIFVMLAAGWDDNV